MHTTSQMPITDIISLSLLLYGAVMGLKNGLIKELASTAGFLVGIYIVWKYHCELGDNILLCLLVWILVPVVFGLAASLVTKFLDFTIIGGLVNRVLGAVVGTCKWGLLVMCVRMMIDKVNEWKTLLETL